MANNIIANAGRLAYDLAFQISPIVLVGGIASSSIGNALPIIALLGQSLGLLQGIVSSGINDQDPFARFVPIPGGTLVNNTIGTYPFANQTVAANAVIQQPLNISLQMIAPVKDLGGYYTKLAILTALQGSLQTHSAQGGTFTIATPAYLYTNCLMTAMTDITSGDTRQQQVLFQLDFTQPLITQQSAANALSAFMNKLSGGGILTSSAPSSASALGGSAAQGAAGALSGSPAGIITYPLGAQPTAPLLGAG
ncbi:MAG TPA: hypothetical protein VN731_10020 [Rhodanobacter sp.]|nr:hypothetical protein [Rhodanobacter sp.]